MGVPSPAKLFKASDPADLVTKFEAYKAALDRSQADPLPAGLTGDQLRSYKSVNRAVKSNKLNKSFSPDLVSSLHREMSFIGKDLDLAGPGSTGGLHQYDLVAPALQLAPHDTPVRNIVPRTQGYGVAHEYKRITGFTGSNTGGLGLIHPLMGETDTNSFGSLSLRRGKSIEYAGDYFSVGFRTFSMSSNTTWDAQYAGQGYESLYQLASTDVLWSSMTLEENMMISDRGTASGFSGALSTPGAPTVTTPAATGSQVAVSGVSGANVYAQVVATTAWGYTAAGTAGTSTFTTGDVITVSWTHVPGATGYRIFLGQGSSAPASSAMWYQASTAANTITLQGAAVVSGANTVAALDPSDNPTAHDSYDGILAYVMDPARTGSLTYVNGPLTTDQVFQDAFANMFDANGADPQALLLNGHDRSALSNILKSSDSASYRINLNNGSDGTVGQLVTGIQNQVTGTMTDLTVSRYMPQGVVPIVSWHLPIPNSQVSNCWAAVNVVDYMGIQWPDIDFLHGFSSRWQGTFVGYSPSFSGCVAGITVS
jgi:hypothetical protein